MTQGTYLRERVQNTPVTSSVAEGRGLTLKDKTRYLINQQRSLDNNCADDTVESVAEQNMTVPQGTTLTNIDISIDGVLEIRGQVTGDVRAQRLIIHPGGNFSGHAQVVDACICHGKAGGTLNGPKIHLSASSHFQGDIHSDEKLIIDGSVVGTIQANALHLSKSSTVVGRIAAANLGIAPGSTVRCSEITCDPTAHLSPAPSPLGITGPNC